MKWYPLCKSTTRTTHLSHGLVIIVSACVACYIIVRRKGENARWACSIDSRELARELQWLNFNWLRSHFEMNRMPPCKKECSGMPQQMNSNTSWVVMCQTKQTYCTLAKNAHCKASFLWTQFVFTLVTLFWLEHVQEQWRLTTTADMPMLPSREDKDNDIII